MLVALRVTAPSSSLPCAGARNAAGGKFLLLVYLKEIAGLWDKKRSSDIREQLGIFNITDK